MKHIFIYAFLQRLPIILRDTGILAGIVAIELLFSFLGQCPGSGFYALWFAITIIALFSVPILRIVRCSSGYACTLLFSDESYLMLTLPVKSETILLGRMLAGLAEFVLCTAAAMALGVILTGFNIQLSADVYSKSREYHGVLGTIGADLLYMVFIRNYRLILLAVFSLLTGFAFIGTAALFAQTAVRSFNVKRRKGLVTLASILIFVLIIFLLGQIQTWTEQLTGLHASMKVYTWNYRESMQMIERVWTVDVPIVSLILSWALSAGLFFSSSWLFKNRIEV